MSTVNSPQALRAAVNGKLGKARQSIHELQQAEQPGFNRYQTPKQSIVDFLQAAYGLLSVIETFAGHPGQLGDFDDWRRVWEAQQLNDAERALWQQMLDDRIAQEHEEGAPLIPVLIPTTRGQMPEDSTNHAVPRKPEPGAFMDGVRFLAYPTRQASDICLQYLELCERFCLAFEAEHCLPKTG